VNGRFVMSSIHMLCMEHCTFRCRLVELGVGDDGWDDTRLYID
jgi:hypothetical protein